MSLNGFITGPDEHGAGLGRGGEPLTYWFTKDPPSRSCSTTRSLRPPGPSSPAARSTTAWTAGVRAGNTGSASWWGEVQFP